MNIIEELNRLTPLGVCLCNKNFIIHTTDAKSSPAIIMAIGLERKKSFEKAGVIVDSALDLDDFDIVTSHHQQSQMFIWDSDKQKIVGGYRYSYNANIPPEHSPMGKYFTFTEQFKKENWIHLGRSFLSIEYQNSRYGIVSLMNALGCLFAKANNGEGFFGKVTVPESYQEKGATDFIVAFCSKYWRDGKSFGFVYPDHQKQASDIVNFTMNYADFQGKYKEVATFLKNNYAMQGLPVLRMYDSLAETFGHIYFLGAFEHADFGGATEIGMSLHKSNISLEAYAEHIEPYL
jgi:hypothetical protein